MKILHVSDLHASKGQLQWVVQESRKYGLVAITGDILDLNKFRPGTTTQVDSGTAHLRAIPVPLAICSGNHDSLPGGGPRLHQAQWLRELKADHVHVDGDCFEMGGQKFRCVGWRADLPQAGPDEIWLIHTPPDRSKTSIARGGVCFGDMLIGDLYRSRGGPNLALSGHVHDAAWKAKVENTWVLNPGFSSHPTTPNYNVIDLDRGIAAHHGASGETDIIRLW